MPPRAEAPSAVAAGGPVPRFVQLDEFYPIRPSQSNSFYAYVADFYMQGFGLDRDKAMTIDLSDVGIPEGYTLETVSPGVAIWSAEVAAELASSSSVPMAEMTLISGTRGSDVGALVGRAAVGVLVGAVVGAVVGQPVTAHSISKYWE